MCFSLLTETTQLTSDEKLLTKAKIMQNIVLTMDNVHTSYCTTETRFRNWEPTLFSIFFIIIFFKFSICFFTSWGDITFEKLEIEHKSTKKYKDI